MEGFRPLFGRHILPLPILMGALLSWGSREMDDRSWRTTGLKRADQEKLLDDIVIVIYVPMARREQKPIFINDDLFGGTFRRAYTGDYHCTKLQVKAMLRDQTENTMDMELLDEVPLDDLNHERIMAYRNRHRTLRSGHPFERLNDGEYLRSIGAAAKSSADGQLHPTAAGMLMFGDEYNIVRHFPEYFLDYREMLDPAIRWTDRVYSSSGEWSGNIFDFYFRVYNRLIRDIKVPFKIKGGDRIDDTPVHEALQEASDVHPMAVNMEKPAYKRA